MAQPPTRRYRVYRFALAACAAVLAAGPAAADPPAPLGAKVADFTRTDATTGKPWALAEGTRGAKATVVVFLNTGCPVGNASARKLAAFHKRYAGEGVAFVAVNSHTLDTAAAVAAHAKELALPFPVLKDDGTALADRFAVDRVPTAFVLDAGRAVRYVGRVDDQDAPGVHKPKATTRELGNAIDAVLDGREVTVPFAAPAGCKLTRERPPAAGAAVTFHKDVAPVLRAKCQECHRAGEAGPFALTSYTQARGWADMIKEVVAAGQMPPWHADAPLGHFANDRRLTPEQKATLLAWVDAGCPEGDPKDAPPPAKFVSGWRLGREPDRVIPMNRTIDVPAQYYFSLSRGMPYQYVEAGQPFAEDTWVQAAEVRPDFRAAVHHVIVFVIPPGGRRALEGNFSEHMLATYVPGDQPTVYPEGMAKKIPKGSQLLFEVHYTPNGKAGTDRTAVGLVLAKGPPEREARGTAAINEKFVIPPGAEAHEVKATRAFKTPVTLLSLTPHMHIRGKAFKFELVTPDGKREVLLNVPKYDFNWQVSYTLAKPRELPAGSKIECTAWFDNSPRNPSNPDPRARVRWGKQTWEEMMIGFVEYVGTE
jgi:peroxiredoxin